MTGTAIYSPCKKYRYTLTREWEFLGETGNKGRLTFVMLNPSTATEDLLDPTVKGCLTRAMKWKFTALSVVNLFAWRSTDPKILRILENPVGVENDKYILQEAERSDVVVCAWGSATPLAEPRSRTVVAMLRKAKIKMHYLRLGKNGAPSHPLYIPFEYLPKVWTP